MNWQSILILAVIVAAAALALWRGKKHGATCSCGKKQCDGCCAGCGGCSEKHR